MEPDAFFTAGSRLIGRLGKSLMLRGLLLGTAESCTGGLAAVLCTNEAGSSRWFAGTVVAYDNSLKTRLLGVEPSLLDRFGAVSGPVAEAMASGALDALGVGVALAVSGIAGPDGGTEDKPVGTVWFATALRGPSAARAKTRSFRVLFDGNRREVRFAAALTGCEAVLAAVEAL